MLLEVWDVSLLSVPRLQQLPDPARGFKAAQRPIPSRIRGLAGWWNCLSVRVLSCGCRDCQALLALLPGVISLPELAVGWCGTARPERASGGASGWRGAGERPCGQRDLPVCPGPCGGQDGHSGVTLRGISEGSGLGFSAAEGRWPWLYQCCWLPAPAGRAGIWGGQDTRGGHVGALGGGPWEWLPVLFHKHNVPAFPSASSVSIKEEIHFPGITSLALGQALGCFGQHQGGAQF
ncbi:uncharacterized protein LOC127463492 isoform X1 [Manacus candei]|uniref:uncharacterized protein LOC127463492 isoform X1 n=1 Tax=Manacus candei TaxID=415023 RepID=UPI0022267168|nr:uncharacterized protein LOC127463492 isoform X1 [Manacus candei]